MCSPVVKSSLSSGQLSACFDLAVLPDLLMPAASSNAFMLLAVKYSKAWPQLVLAGHCVHPSMSNGSGTDQGSQC